MFAQVEVLAVCTVFAGFLIKHRAENHFLNLFTELKLEKKIFFSNFATASSVKQKWHKEFTEIQIGQQYLASSLFTKHAYLSSCILVH